MKEDSPPSLPAAELELKPHLWEKVLAEYPNLIVEVDNQAARGVRLATSITSGSSENSLMDADGDLQVSLEELAEAYSIGRNDSDTPDPRIELDFPHYPALVRFWDILPRDGQDLSSMMTSLFSTGKTLSLDDLQDIRDETYPERPMCPCCETKAKERTRYASIHPLFDILMQATRSPDTLRARILSHYADYSMPLRPYQVETHGGVISAVDKENNSAFHVDLKHLHAMRIRKVELDGTAYAQLIGYNSVGLEIFHLASPNPNDVHEWTQCCEWSKQFFTSS